MRAVVQRVAASSVFVGEREISRTGKGLLVLLGVGQEDKKEDARYLADKVVNLRIFEDEAGKMNLSVKDIKGEIMAVSQFTLYGDCRQGRRPGFSAAAAPQVAEQLYEFFIEQIKQQGIPVATGIFQEHMLVNLKNDGPVTMLLDSHKLF